MIDVAAPAWLKFDFMGHNIQKWGMRKRGNNRFTFFEIEVGSISVIVEILGTCVNCT